MAEYTLGSLSIFDITSAPIHTKLTNVDFSANSEVTGDDSGGLYEETLSLTGFAPVANMTSKAIATILGFISLDGQCIGTGKAVTRVDVISRKLQTCKTTLSSTPHMLHRVNTGLLRLATLKADRNQDATISVILDAFTDGTNAPIAETDGVAMPSPLVNQRYRLGLSKIAGIQFPDIEGISIEYNIGITDKSPALASIWPEQAGVITARPTLVLSGRDLSKVKTGLIALGATAATHANTTIQLIKLKDAASFESFGSSAHIKITIAGLAVPDSLVNVSAGSRATNEIRIPLQHDGTNVPIIVSTSSTYNANP